MSTVAEPLASSTRDEKHFEGARLVQRKPELEHAVETDHGVAETPSAIPPPPSDPVDDLPLHHVIRLFRSPTPGSAANRATRSSAARRIQRTIGNRASQQIVQRAYTMQRKCDCGGTCAKCQQEEQQRQNPQLQSPRQSPIQSPVQRSSAANAPAEFDGIPASPGEQLDPATRRPMEAHFGADLADVRVHTGSEAAKSATSLDALAYTSGRDIYFASGMYAPSSDSGRRLLAHEVAHVVQQGSGKEPSLATKSSHGAKIGAPDDPLEGEADRAAEQFMTAPVTDEEERKKRESTSGMPASPMQRSIQRQPAPDPSTSIAPVAATPSPAPQDAGPTPAPAVAPPAAAVDGSTPAPAPSHAPGGLDAEQYKRLITARAILSKVPKIDDAFKADLAKALPAAAVKQQMAIRDAKAARLAEASEELDSLQPSAGLPDETTEARMNVLEHEIDRLNQEIPALNASILGTLNELKIPGETQADKEENLVKFVTETFPARFESRAEQIVMSELDENAKIAQAEKARYRDICTEEGDDAGQKNRDGLRAAAKDLALRAFIIDGLKHDFYEAEARVPAAGVSPEGELAGNLREAVDQKNRELDETRKQYGLKFPILLREGVDIQALASSSDKDLNEMVGGQVDKVLEDIEETKGNLLSKKLRIWDLTDPKTGYDVIGITEQDLSIEEPLLLDVIKQWVQKEKSDEAAWDLFFAALAITATIVATLATLPAGGWGGAIVGGIIGVAQLASDVSKYSALDAANDVALDPEIAKIAKDEPSIFWVVVDVVFVMLDVSAAKNAIRAMRAPAQALLEGGSVAEFAVQAKELAPDAADRLIASAEKTVATRELPGGLKSIAEAAEEEQGVLAHAFTDEGHEIKVSADGITRCSPGVACPLVKNTFAKQVAEDHQAAEELSQAESLAKTDPKAAVAAAKAAERRLVTQALIDEMDPKVIEQLKDLGIDGEGLHRILANGSDLNNVKGRLYDEIFASHAKKLMETGAGKQALAGGKKLSPELAEKLEFIPGSSIKDMHGEDLTDGILAWREGNKLHVVNIFEAKASRNAASDLRVIEERASQLPKKEIEAAREYAQELFKEFSEEAAKMNKPVGLTVEDILEDLQEYAKTKQWGGQIRQTIERLDISVATDHDLDLLTKIKVDGEVMEVADISASSKITGVVPSDVNLKRLQKDMVKPLEEGGLGLKGFDVLKTPQKQQEVLDLAQQISNGAKNAAGAAD